jgi:GTP-dependent phosphoenolpyruvate carboxykinase
MKIRIVKPVGERMVPYPKPPYAPIPADGCRVEYPGDDGYWVRLANDGVITVTNPDAPVVAPAPKKMKEV